MKLYTIQLSEDEREAVIAALHAYRFETTQYLQSTDRAGLTHDECCDAARARAADRARDRERLNARLRYIDGALQGVQG